MTAPEVNAWFVREVLPLETALIQYLRYARRNQGDAEDLCQEVYIRVYEAAKKEIPQSPKSYIFTVARNLMIRRAQRDQIIPIQSIADPDELGIAFDEPLPDRTIMARQELGRLETALENLPPRYRDVVKLSRIEGLTRSEIAIRMNISEGSVSTYLAEGMVKLANLLLHGGKTP